MVLGTDLVVGPIDPFRRLTGGWYVDELVSVSAVRPGTGRLVGPAGAEARIVAGEHFDVWRQDRRLVVEHRIPRDAVDDALTDVINAELFNPGWVTGGDLFERIFTGVVLSSAPDPVEAWALFYENSLGRHDAAPEVTDLATDSPATFAAIHRHADELVPPDVSVLEVGCCFGFLSLRLAGHDGRRVIASDLTAGTVGLLRVMADRLQVPLSTLVADAARIPRPDRSVDVVMLIHVLEHLEDGHGRRALDEALRVAARRVVIAVPYEEEPTAAFGHVRRIDRGDLERWGEAAPGWTAAVHDHLGGWLVLDRR